MLTSLVWLTVGRTSRAARFDRALIDRDAELARLRPWVERARNFSGWDFSEIQMRELEPGPPWDYRALVREAAARKRRVLDMGTGGGELLADMRGALPDGVVATEEWVVNAPVAYRRLNPLGVDVVRCSSLRLPFSDNSFDLLINRHEELDSSEVARVLRPGGLLITQQVGLHNNHELRAFFPRMSDFGDIFAQYTQELRALEFEVEGEHHDFKVAYGSLGDLVYLLSVTPWTIPDFDVERDLEALLVFDADRLTEDGIVVTECRFLLTARKPV